MQVTTVQTRQCPFCAETILKAAVKCRFCGEFLNTDRARALTRQAGGTSVADGENGEQTNLEQLLFAGQPSLWAMAGAIAKASVVMAIALVLVFWHIEHIAALKISAEHAAVVGRYRPLLGVALGLVVLMVLAYKVLELKMTSYAVSAERIEYSRGILDRRVDNLDMFRVIDLKLRRSFLDCLVGVGTVMLTTTDKSHPEFVFQKIRYARELYDAIKKASLSADRRTNVIHME